MVASTQPSQSHVDADASLVLAERIDAALVVRINRPDAGNAVSHDVALAMRAHVDAAARDQSLGALILTGAGTRYFCSGGDLKAYALIESPDELNRIFGTIRDTLDALEALDIPVIAAVNGFALGGGAEILLACDVRIAEEGARIGFPQSRLGLLPGWDGTERLLRIVGRARALRLLVGEPRLHAKEAMALGLVDEVVADGAALTRALAIAASFAGVAPLALREAKSILRAGSQGTFAERRQQGRDAFAKLWFTADHKEAEVAFAAKRKPHFVGN